MNTYYNPEDLGKFSTVGEEAPELWDKFMAYYGGSMADGALTAREKALIALAVAYAEMCPYCIDQYTQNLLQMGLEEEQIMEAIHVTAAMKAGITLVHGVQSKNIIDQLEM
ncbi:MAG: carboxymuconolactone decarboxylase family protein [Clostridia bacterium]|nr:carboxymuconolactone decarboxylase family protein [Clostridia bacterium]